MHSLFAQPPLPTLTKTSHPLPLAFNHLMAFQLLTHGKDIAIYNYKPELKSNKKMQHPGNTDPDSFRKTRNLSQLDLLELSES